jgi:hypothetical protein
MVDETVGSTKKLASSIREMMVVLDKRFDSFDKRFDRLEKLMEDVRSQITYALGVAPPTIFASTTSKRGRKRRNAGASEWTPC